MFIDSPSTLCATPGFERQVDYEATFAQDDVFVADDLPDFAKSSILPRKMKKEAVEARMKEVFNHEQDEDGEVIREKSFDNFKISLLKTSLEHYDNLAAPPPPVKDTKTYKGKNVALFCISGKKDVII